MPVAKVRLNFSELIDHGAEKRKLEEKKVISVLEDVLLEAEIALANAQQEHEDNSLESGVVHNASVRDLELNYLKLLVFSAKMMQIRHSRIAYTLGYVHYQHSQCRCGCVFYACWLSESRCHLRIRNCEIQ
jgi:hypothetical protein